MRKPVCKRVSIPSAGVVCPSCRVLVKIVGGKSKKGGPIECAARRLDSRQSGDGTPADGTGDPPHARYYSPRLAIF